MLKFLDFDAENLCTLRKYELFSTFRILYYKFVNDGSFLLIVAAVQFSCIIDCL